MAQELIVLDENLIEASYKAGNFQDIIDFIKNEVDINRVYDMSTRKGREECASTAYKVARTKTLIDKHGAEMIRSLKAKIADEEKLIRDGKKVITEALGAIQSTVRSPLDQWEAIRREVDERIKQINSLTQGLINESSESIDNKIAMLEGYEGESSAVVEDKLHDYLEAIEEARKILEGQYEVARQREKDQAELKELRAKQNLSNETEEFKPGGSSSGPAPVAESIPEPIKDQVDTDHKGEVHRAIVKQLVKTCPIAEASAKAVVAAIVRGQIDNVTISY